MPAPTVTAPSSTQLDQSDESPTTALYRAAIGPVNSDYYLPIFTRFEAADRATPCWNWAASLYTLNWMVFRKLWGAALVYVAVVGAAALAVLGLGSLFFQYAETTKLGLLAALIALGFVVPGFFGNAVLHAACRRKMGRALAESATLREACASLERQASSRQRFIWLVLANAALAAVPAAVYLALPKTASPPTSVRQSEKVQIPAPHPATGQAPGPVAASVAPAQPASAPTQPASAPAQLASAPAQTIAEAPDAVGCTDCPRPAGAEASAPAAAPAQHFYINVGLFAVAANARNAHARLRQAGVAGANMQEIQTAKGKRTRLRVGPLPTRSEADAVAQNIRALKLEAAVIQQ